MEEIENSLKQVKEERNDFMRENQRLIKLIQEKEQQVETSTGSGAKEEEDLKSEKGEGEFHSPLNQEGGLTFSFIHSVTPSLKNVTEPEDCVEYERAS